MKSDYTRIVNRNLRKDYQRQEIKQHSEFQYSTSLEHCLVSFGDNLTDFIANIWNRTVVPVCVSWMILAEKYPFFDKIDNFINTYFNPFNFP